MQAPAEAASFANTTWPTLVAGVAAESDAQYLAPRGMRSVRRQYVPVYHYYGEDRLIWTCRGSESQQNETRSFTEEAILCGDSIDPRGTNMTDVFEIIISASRNTSEMCSFTFLSSYLSVFTEHDDTVSAGWPTSFYTCPFWPVRAVERYSGPFNKTLANKVMVVSNTVCTLIPFYLRRTSTHTIYVVRSSYPSSRS